MDLQEKQNDIFRLSEENNKKKDRMVVMDSKIKDLEGLVQQSNPKQLRDQRDLLIDLRQKVVMYERELDLINESSR